MDARLARTATVNSALLTFLFTTNTAAAFASGHTIFGIIGVIATVLTARDTYQLFKAS